MKNQIKKLFDNLSTFEKVELLKELSTLIPNTATAISEFSMRYQRRFGKDITFEIYKSGLDHAPTIRAIMPTDIGVYEGVGSNQKIAKANAIQKALDPGKF